MKMHFTLAAIAACAVAACGGPTIIDEVKQARLAECPSNDIGDIVNGFYQTTSWTAYNGDTDATKKIYAEGDVMFVGAIQKAKLGFVYEEADGRVTLEGVSLSGKEQPIGIATMLVQRMCEDARD